MDLLTGRPNHIEDYLISLHDGQWFGWKDHTNKVWENLIILGSQDKPTKEQCEQGLVDLQQEFDDGSYVKNRALNYPSLGDQLDMLWHAIDAGTLNKTSDFYKTIKAVKDAHPKSE
jgi:hypothetical protein